MALNTGRENKSSCADCFFNFFNKSPNEKKDIGWDLHILVYDNKDLELKKYPKKKLKLYGYKALCTAIMQGKLDIAIYLIEECGLEMNKNNNKYDPQHSELLKNITDMKNIEKITDLLLKSSKNKLEPTFCYHLLFNICSNRDDKSEEVTQQRINVFKKLVNQQRVDVNLHNQSGTNPLLFVIEDNNVVFCRLLLAHGADICVKLKDHSYYDKPYETPISLALKNNHKDLFQELLNYAIEKSKAGKCNLKEAIGPTIIYAVALYDLDILQRLLQLGADVNAVDYSHRNALYWIAQMIFKKPDLYWFKCIETMAQLEKVLSILLETGIDYTNKTRERSDKIFSDAGGGTALEYLHDKLRCNDEFIKRGNKSFIKDIQIEMINYLINFINNWDANFKKRKLLRECISTLFPLPLTNLMCEYALDLEEAQKTSVARTNCRPRDHS